MVWVLREGPADKLQPSGELCVPRSESSSASDPADSVNFSVIVNLKDNNVNISMAFIAKKKKVTYSSLSEHF